jgi:hypothetical protein
MAGGCCGASADIATDEICGFLAGQPTVPGCVASTDKVTVMRGTTCYTIPVCQIAPRYRMVA